MGKPKRSSENNSLAQSSSVGTIAQQDNKKPWQVGGEKLERPNKTTSKTTPKPNDVRKAKAEPATIEQAKEQAKAGFLAVLKGESKKDLNDTEAKKLLLDESDVKKQDEAAKILARFTAFAIKKEKSNEANAKQKLKRQVEIYQLKDKINKDADKKAMFYGLFQGTAIVGYWLWLMGMHKVDFTNLAWQEGLALGGALLGSLAFIVAVSFLNYRLIRISMAQQELRAFDRKREKDLEHTWQLRLASVAAYLGAGLITGFVFLGNYEVFEAFADTSDTLTLALGAVGILGLTLIFIGRPEKNLNEEANKNLIAEWNENRKKNPGLLGFFKSLVPTESFWQEQAAKFGKKGLSEENKNAIKKEFTKYFGISIFGMVGTAYVGLPAFAGLMGGTEFAWIVATMILTVGFVCSLAFYRDRALTMAKLKADDLSKPTVQEISAESPDYGSEYKNQGFFDRNYSVFRGLNATGSVIPAVLAVIGVSGIDAKCFIKEKFWEGGYGDDFYVEAAFVLLFAVLLGATAGGCSWTAGADQNTNPLPVDETAKDIVAMAETAQVEPGSPASTFWTPGWQKEVDSLTTLSGAESNYARNYANIEDFEKDLNDVVSTAPRAAA
jgi:hypothetical protein